LDTRFREKDNETIVKWRVILCKPSGKGISEWGIKKFSNKKEW
jgi:hypothetical protein